MAKKRGRLAWLELTAIAKEAPLPLTSSRAEDTALVTDDNDQTLSLPRQGLD